MRGEPYQFFLNTPWGENLENQYRRTYTSFSSRFRFNGKEWDDETGNFYYGARYYDPKISVWLSVDPLAAKFNNLSPYHYTVNNPLNVIDYDGRDTTFEDSHLRAKVKSYIDPNHKDYDPEFAARFQEIVNDSRMFIYRKVKGRVSTVSYDGKDVYVNISKNNAKSNLGIGTRIFEETEHLTQLIHGEWGFVLDKPSGTYKAVGLDQWDEANGWLFSLRAPDAYFYRSDRTGQTRKAVDNKDILSIKNISTARDASYGQLPSQSISAVADLLATYGRTPANTIGIIRPVKSRITPLTQVNNGTFKF